MPETFLDADTIRANAAGSGWSPVTVVASTGSTNADLAALAREGAPGGTVLIAGHQSSGRGRLARPWVAPPDTSLACSVLVEPRRGTADWGWLPLLVGMAVSDGIREETGVDARLKWPNDVLVGDRKLSGILCEAVTVGPRATAVLGFGINVTLGADQLPVPTATSTALEGSGSSGTAIVSAVLGRLADRYEAWDRGEDLLDAYRERCTTLGRVVDVALGVLRGTAVDIDPQGGLVLETANGRRTLVAGDVVHVRRA